MARMNKCKSYNFCFTISLFILAILLNYFYLAFFKYQFFKNMALRQHQTISTISPERSTIFDTNGIPVAFSRNSYSAFICPKKIANYKQLIEYLNNNFPNISENLKRYKNKYFMYIKRHLTKSEMKELERIDDIHFLEEPKRVCKYDSLIPVVGITDIDNKGLTGIEYFYDKYLTGEQKSYILKKDGKTKQYLKKEIAPQQEPNPLHITIDSELQELTNNELLETIDYHKAKEGAVVIMNPENGNILSMISYPGYIKNNIEGTKNRCITQPYESGSVIKTFLALSALEEGVTEPNEIIDCEDKVTTFINGMVVNTVKPHGKITFSNIIQTSNNIGIVKVGLRLNEKIYDYYKKFGFSEKSLAENLGEEIGVLFNPKKWTKRSVISLSFGYELSTNLLQLVKGYGIIANGGYEIKPHLIKNEDAKKGKKLFKDSSIKEINEILLKTVNEGTARRAKIKGYKIKAKTGSAYCAANGTYDKTKSIYTCVAIVEKNNYKRVIGAYIKEPESRKKIYASQVVVPMIEKIIERTLIHDKKIN